MHPDGCVLPLQVSTLLCARDVPMALRTLATLRASVDQRVDLVVHDDGTLGADDVARLEAELGAQVLTRAECDDRVLPELSGRPACRRYRAGPFVWGLKLLDVPMLSTDTVRYCDSDVAWFERTTGAFSVPLGAGAVFMLDDRGAHSLGVRGLRTGRALLPSRANAGLFTLRKDAYDLDFVEWWLSRSELNATPTFSEQSCLSALGRRAGCHLYDATQVRVVDASSGPAGLAVGHYTTPGRARLLSDLDAVGTCTHERATILRTTPAPDAGLLGLAASGLRYRMGVRRARFVHVAEARLTVHSTRRRTPTP